MDKTRNDEMWMLLECIEKASNMKLVVKGTRCEGSPLAICGHIAEHSGTGRAVVYKEICRFGSAYELGAWLDGISFANS